LLEAVACSGAARGRVLAALDAGRGDVYVGDYELGPQACMNVRTNVRMNVRMHSERLLSREEFVVEARGSETMSSEARGNVVVTPDAALAETVRAAGIRVELIEYPNAGMIARLGWEHLQRGQTASPEELDANYIRHSDAEIFSKPAP